MNNAIPNNPNYDMPDDSFFRFYFLIHKNRIFTKKCSLNVACHAKHKKLTSKIQKNLLRVKKKPLDEEIKRLKLYNSKNIRNFASESNADIFQKL